MFSNVPMPCQSLSIAFFLVEDVVVKDWDYFTELDDLFNRTSKADGIELNYDKQLDLFILIFPHSVISRCHGFIFYSFKDNTIEYGASVQCEIL